MKKDIAALHLHKALNRPDCFCIPIQLFHIRNPEIGLSARIIVDKNAGPDQFIHINLHEMK